MDRDDDDSSNGASAAPAPAPQTLDGGASEIPSADEDLEDLLGPKPASSREIQKTQSRAIGIARVNAVNPGPGRIPGGKQTPERMRGILKEISRLPNVSRACRLWNLHPTSLGQWLEKSARGLAGDQWDIVINPEDPPEEHEVRRFHELYDAAMREAVDLVEEAAFTRAVGYEEVLCYQGQLTYRCDPEMMELLAIYDPKNPKIWARDENGKPILETVTKQDPDMISLILKHRKPEVYGNKIDVNHTHSGGVLIVAAKAATGAILNIEEAQYKREAIDVEFEEEDPQQ